MVTRWKFNDAVAVEEITFPFNPRAVSGPHYEKNIEFEATAGPDGKTLIWEGRPQPQTITFEGSTYTAQAHADFVTWWEKSNQVTLTDDLGTQMVVYLTKYRPKRVHSAVNPHKRTYEFEAVVLDWP